MKEWYKNSKNSIDNRRNTRRTSNYKEDDSKALEDKNTFEDIKDIEVIEDIVVEKEFDSFFKEVLEKIPEKYSGIVLNTYEKSRDQAEKILVKSKTQYDNIFDKFLEGVDEEVKKKSHRTIHAASLTAAIIGLSPIPFSDALLLVPIQLTMMARLHKLYGFNFSENLGEAVARELILVGLGRSAVGNLLKFIPAVGTVAGAAINSVVASTITQALGWVTVKMLNDGEDIFDDVMSFKNQFTNLFKTLNDSNKKTD